MAPHARDSKTEFNGRVLLDNLLCGPGTGWWQRGGAVRGKQVRMSGTCVWRAGVRGPLGTVRSRQ